MHNVAPGAAPVGQDFRANSQALQPKLWPPCARTARSRWGQFHSLPTSCVSAPTLAHHSPALQSLLSRQCPLGDWNFRESEEFVLLVLCHISRTWRTAGAPQVLSVWMDDGWLVELVEWLSGWTAGWLDVWMEGSLRNRVAPLCDLESVCNAEETVLFFFFFLYTCNVSVWRQPQTLLTNSKL